MGLFSSKSKKTDAFRPQYEAPGFTEPENKSTVWLVHPNEPDFVGVMRVMTNLSSYLRKLTEGGQAKYVVQFSLITAFNSDELNRGDVVIYPWDLDGEWNGTADIARAAKMLKIQVYQAESVKFILLGCPMLEEASPSAQSNLRGVSTGLELADGVQTTLSYRDCNVDFLTNHGYTPSGGMTCLPSIIDEHFTFVFGDDILPREDDIFDINDLYPKSKWTCGCGGS